MATLDKITLTIASALMGLDFLGNWLTGDGASWLWLLGIPGIVLACIGMWREA